MTLEVDLGAACEAKVEALIEKGAYRSADAVLKAGVGLLLERERALAKLEADAEATERNRAEGRLVDAEEAFDEMDAQIAAAFAKPATAA